jgi:hypothetical protein
MVEFLDALAAVAVIQVDTAARRQVISNAFPVGDKMAIQMPPELALPGKILMWKWSADGQTILAFRQDPDLSTPAWLTQIQGKEAKNASSPTPVTRPIELWQFSVARHSATRLWRTTDPKFVPYELVAVPKSSAFIFSGTKPGQDAFLDGFFVNGKGKVTRINGEAENFGLVMDSPRSDVLGVGASEVNDGVPSRQWIGLIGPNGLVRRMDMPDSFVTAQWSDAGTDLIALVKQPPAPGTTRPKFTWNRVDFGSSSILPYEQPPSKEGSPPKPRDAGSTAGVFDVSVSIPGKSAPVKVGLVMSGSNAGLIASDVTAMELSPSGLAAAYVAQGALFYKPIVLVDAKAFQDLVDELAREEAISTAKQVGMSFMLLAADFDDVLPSARTDWKKQVSPYSKSAEMVNQFVYTFRGGNLAEIKEPSKEVMGYVPGPGGRAVTYLDGHVKWVKN